MFIQAAQFIKGIFPKKPSIGLVLGSGLGVLADAIEKPVMIDYSDIPGFSHTTVEGHIGRFVCGEYQNKTVIAMQGRFHYYEGKALEEVVFPIRVLKSLGVETLIITNAAGGVNMDFHPGDIMLITDHINLSGVNPLRGRNDESVGPRFPDMSYAYSSKLRELAAEKAAQTGIHIRRGVYAMMSGPSYETPAEIRMLRTLGADAVGMSTVPEVVTAVHAGMSVLGLSCITNMAAGVLDQPLNHHEVMETADKTKKSFEKLINAVISSI